MCLPMMNFEFSMKLNNDWYVTLGLWFNNLGDILIFHFWEVRLTIKLNSLTFHIYIVTRDIVNVHNKL